MSIEESNRARAIAALEAASRVHQRTSNGGQSYGAATAGDQEVLRTAEAFLNWLEKQV